MKNTIFIDFTQINIKIIFINLLKIENIFQKNYIF